MKSVGQVSLVGAGPGDPELITIRGKNRLESADVVIHDELIGRQLLDFCRPSCEKIHAGKRCGDHAAVQSQIVRLLILHAKLGKRVVRLKGGDPFVFGRGGEELEALIAEGIPTEIVPGVTAACSAAAVAGVPLTHRDCASAVVFLTGQENPSKPELAVDWAAYASLNATLCIYMGGRRVSEIAARLITGGMDASIPVALVSRATWADQRIERCSVGDLRGGTPDRVPLPAMVIIGEVARDPTKAREIAAMAKSASTSGGGSAATS
jgi:uroporphyrin-III C-methyltransferase